jgi:hypothetical protein
LAWEIDLILDYNPTARVFFLRVPRGEADIQELMNHHGLDFSVTASTPDEAVLLTHEPFAAVTFFKHATVRARAELEEISLEIALSRADHSGSHYRVPYDRDLWPYQKADLDFGLRRTHWLDADEPGLGKTPTAIVYCNELKARHVLVICPGRLRLQWTKRIREWTTMETPFTVYPISSSRCGVPPTGSDNPPSWSVVSFELARTDAIHRALSKEKYDVLIIDEAHYLKGSDRRRTRAVFGARNLEIHGLSERAAHILALTGTPLPNRPREAYTLARGLCFDAIDWMSEDDFKDRFNPSRQFETQDGRVFNDERSGRHFELQNRLRYNFMARHLEKDVNKQRKLPIYDLIQVEETKSVRAALQAEALLDIDPDAFEGSEAAIDGAVSTARKLMGIAIAPQAAEYISIALDGGEEKVVVFAWHTDVMDIIERDLARYGVARVDGRTSATQTAARVRAFIEQPKPRVILGNVLTLGTGTDGLQDVSSHVFLVEPDWVHGNNEQCFKRLDRNGQRFQVQGDIFVAPGSLSERILAQALRKGGTTTKALDVEWGQVA